MNEKFMRLALGLAEKGNPSPNPCVGAVIVKNGKILGSGYHKKAGMPHAEVEAIKNAGINAKGATLYVNLEPCNHYGRTPPCTKAIIKAGVRKVVVAMKDPNPDVKGGGEEELRKRWIKIEKGIMESEAKKLNEVFVKYSKTKIPFVVAKAAMSLDGKIATRTGDSKWITGENARRYAHKLRSRYDAVLAGINTVLKDNPRLTSRIRGGRNPLRVVLDDTLKIPLDANVAGKGTIIATTERFDTGKKAALESRGIRVLMCGRKRVDLKTLLKKLGEMGITSLLVEGGAEVQGSFLDAKLIDKLVFFYAPKLIGGNDAKCAFAAQGAENPAGAVNVRIERMKKLGKDLLVEGYPEYRRK